MDFQAECCCMISSESCLCYKEKKKKKKKKELHLQQNINMWASASKDPSDSARCGSSFNGCLYDEDIKQWHAHVPPMSFIY